MGPFQGATGKSVAETASHFTHASTREANPQADSPNSWVPSLRQAWSRSNGRANVSRTEHACRRLPPVQGVHMHFSLLGVSGWVQLPSSDPSSLRSAYWLEGHRNQDLAPTSPPHVLVCHPTEENKGSVCQSRSCH